jgi:hypothetical protein
MFSVSCPCPSAIGKKADATTSRATFEVVVDIVYIDRAEDMAP